MKLNTTDKQSKLQIGFNKLILIAIGFGALVWFLILVHGTLTINRR